MAGLSLTDVKTLLDSLAQQALNIQTLGFGANTTGYTNNRATIRTASSSADFSALADCAAAFSQDLSVNIASLYQSRFAALDRHVHGLNAYLLANDTRVHPALRDVLSWLTLNPPTFFQTPVLAGATKLGSYLLSGAGAGTFTDGAAVNPALFGKIWITLKCTTNVTTSIVVTVVGTKIDGSPQTKSATITGGAVIGNHFPVGSLGTSADHFMDVSSVTVSGGEATDAFDIESQLERVIAL